MNSTPIYKTRKFWVIFLSVQFTISFLVFLPSALSEHTNISVIHAVAIASGLGFYSALISMSLGFHLLFSYITHTAITTLLLIKTFRSGSIKIAYPVTLSVTSLVSTILSYTVFGAF